MKVVRVSTAARMKGVTRNSGYAAIKAGKLRSVSLKATQVRVILSSLKLWTPNPNMITAKEKQDD